MRIRNRKYGGRKKKRDCFRSVPNLEGGKRDRLEEGKKGFVVEKGNQG